MPSTASVKPIQTWKWGDGQANSKKDGWRWSDPNDVGNGVRWDKGNPNSSWPSQQEDQVRVTSGGKVIGPDGNPIDRTETDPKPSRLPESHIPSDDYEQWQDWNKP
jgi:hypothetical protein